MIPHLSPLHCPVCTQAVKWLEMLSSLVPNDPGVLARLGAIHARADDETRALHYYQVGRDGMPFPLQY